MILYDLLPHLCEPRQDQTINFASGSFTCCREESDKILCSGILIHITVLAVLLYI